MKMPSKINNNIIIDIKDFSTCAHQKDGFYAIKLLPVEIANGYYDIILIDFYVKNKQGEITLNNIGNEIGISPDLKPYVQ